MYMEGDYEPDKSIAEEEIKMNGRPHCPSMPEI